MPKDDSTIVAKLKAAGAIILGKTNVTELNGLFDANIPEGYSSLGGQVLLPSDTDKTPAGSSGGSAAATAAGLAALTVGLETSTDTAQLIAPAGVAGVVGLKPTVGRCRRRRAPVAKRRTRPARSPAPSPTPRPAPARPATSDYSASRRRWPARGSRHQQHDGAVPGRGRRAAGRGRDDRRQDGRTPPPNPASIVTREFKRDLNAYLADTSGGARSLQEIINYNTANPVEGLKYQQGELTAALAPDPSAYAADHAAGLASNRAVIDALLADGSDAVMVPSGNALVGIADRAGYPVLTVPAGYGTGGAGRNPIGVTFVGPDSEAKLLAGGYAFEQATNVRLAPLSRTRACGAACRGARSSLRTTATPATCSPRPPLGRSSSRSRVTSAAPCRRRSRSSSGTRRRSARSPRAWRRPTPRRPPRPSSRRPVTTLTVADPSPVATGKAGQRGVLARVAAGRARGRQDLRRAGLQRRRDRHVHAGDQRHRAAPHGRVLEDAGVHAEHHHAVTVASAGPSGPALDQPVLVGVDHGLHPVPEAELAEQVGHVALGCGLGDHERGGDLGVGEAAGDQLQDLALPLGEGVDARSGAVGGLGEPVRDAVEELAGDLRGEHRVTRRDRLHGLDELLAGHVLGQEA